MRIQILSDLHTEFYKSFPRIPPATGADTLVLAGDIGTLGKREILVGFLEYCSANWKNVIYVPGNHELYHSRCTFQEILTELETICGGLPNIHFLVNKTVIVDGYVFVGTPLFPQITGGRCEIMNDFTRIQRKDERGWTTPITPQVWNAELSAPQWEWFTEEMTRLRDSHPPHKIIVVTHYPPIRDGTSHPKYDTQPDEVKQYFSSNQEEMLRRLVGGYVDFTGTPPMTMISGHTHYSYDFERGGIRYISRALGYPGEHEESLFDEFADFVDLN